MPVKLERSERDGDGDGSIHMRGVEGRVLFAFEVVLEVEIEAEAEVDEPSCA